MKYILLIIATILQFSLWLLPVYLVVTTKTGEWGFLYVPIALLTWAWFAIIEDFFKQNKPDPN